MSIKFVLAISLFCYVYLVPIFCQSQDFDDHHFREAKDRDRFSSPVPLPTSRPSGGSQITNQQNDSRNQMQGRGPMATPPYRRPGDSPNLSQGRGPMATPAYQRPGDSPNLSQGRGPVASPGESQTSPRPQSQRPSDSRNLSQGRGPVASPGGSQTSPMLPSQRPGGSRNWLQGGGRVPVECSTPWTQTPSNQNNSPQGSLQLYYVQRISLHAPTATDYKKQESKQNINCMLHQNELVCRKEVNSQKKRNFTIIFS